MDKSDLHERLQELHSALQRLRELGERERRDLEELREDIRGLLEERGEADTPARRRIHARLLESVGQFEVSHPTLARLMGETMDTLAKMGI